MRLRKENFILRQQNELNQIREEKMIPLGKDTPHSTEWKPEGKGEKDGKGKGEKDLSQANQADHDVGVPADMDRDVEVDTDGDMSRLPSYRTYNDVQNLTDDK
jgi:hypothetical protein